MHPSLRSTTRTATVVLLAMMVLLGLVQPATAARAEDPTPPATQTPSPTLTVETPPASPDAPKAPTTTKAPAARNLASAAPLVEPVPTRPPGQPEWYTPPEDTLFSHWNDATKFLVRNRLLHAIRSVPRGGQIRWIVYSFGDKNIADALIQARLRGVSVQLIANSHNYSIWPEWRRMRAALGIATHRAGVPDSVISFAFMCVGSCRGLSGGHEHLKLFQFSQVATARHVTMFGSWNPTTVANDRQWNHLNTIYEPATYSAYQTIFDQAKLDRYAGYRNFVTGGITNWVFPRAGTVASGDFMLTELNSVRCTGITGTAGRNHRTFIRIAMYAWYDKRGDWLARRVRQLWEQGCDIAIIGGIMSNSARTILYSPGGRGRIPMKYAIDYDRAGYPNHYLHNKSLLVSGVLGADTNAWTLYTGSSNFSSLAFVVDDMTLRLNGPGVVIPYIKDFDAVWRGPNMHTPAPAPIIVVDGRVKAGQTMPSNQLESPLGTGKYKYLEAD